MLTARSGMMAIHRWLACAMLAFAPALAQAQASAPAEINIPPQALESALRQLASTHNLQILYDPRDLQGLSTAGVKGRMPASQAIEKMIDGTGLAVSFGDQGSVVIRPIAAKKMQGEAAENPTPLAQAPSPGAGASSEDGRVGSARKVEKVEVTGSRVKRAEIEGALPVNVYTSEDIARSGQASLAGFLNTLNEVSVVSSESANFQITTGQPTVQLRGLPVGMTLVLVNGRRMQGTGASASGALLNLDLIPLAAIERIEILSVGASAVYGGDALAGVVNIILKKSMEGAVAEVRYGHAAGTDDGAASFAVGSRGERGSVLAIAAYSHRSTLRGDERDITNDADYRRFGGPDARVPFCNPGTVYSLGGNLPGLNGTFAAMPDNPSGRRLTPADFASSVGSANRCSRVKYFPLVWGSSAASAWVTADYTLAAPLTVFAELGYTKSKLDSTRGGQTLGGVVVPASNAFNPFGVAVRVNGATAPDSVTGRATLDTEFVRPLLGARGSLGMNWDYELTVSTARDRSNNTEASQNVNFPAYMAALASGDPATALNVFTTGAAGSPGVLAGIYSPRQYLADGSRDAAVAFARGSLWRLPAGSLDAIVGAEYNRDRYVFHEASSGQDGDLHRSVRSLFAELRAPILRGMGADGVAFEKVTLTAAVRRDDYSDFGAANTKQFGLEWRPLRSLLFRAARSEAFKPPLLVQLYGQSFDFPGEIFGVVDPRRGGQPIVGATIHFSPTADLKPETGVAKAIGMIWEPQSIAGLRASLNFWRIDQKDRVIVPQDPQSILDNEALLPAYVTRGPATGGQPGPVTLISWRYLNFGKYLVEGIDYEVGYAFPSTSGRWSAVASASETTRYDTSLIPGSPIVDRLGHPDAEGWAPRWKGRMQVGWQHGPYSVGITGRYVGKYFDYGSTTRTLGNEWFMDLSGAVEVGRALGITVKPFNRATAILSVVNATNRLPKYASTPPGYDTFQADIRGRYVSMQISVPWQ